MISSHSFLEAVILSRFLESVDLVGNSDITVKRVLTVGVSREGFDPDRAVRVPVII